ncbi:MAG: MFS transporter [Treponema sp.]|jgi:hypothetical protein|nr:MFS transporter [Treponema sp.]
MFKLPPKIEPYYVYTALFVYFFSINFMVSVSTVYLLSKGLTYFHVNALDSLELAIVFFLEIPTGIIGDRFGNKVSFQVSMIFRAVFYFFLTITSSFVILCAVFFILAFSEACWSGSFTAWYIERLQKENCSEEHIRLFSNNIVLDSIAGIIAGFIGAIIANSNIAMGYRIAAGLIILSASMLVLIPDRRESQCATETYTGPVKLIPDIKEIIRTAQGFFAGNDFRQWELIFPLIIGFTAVSGIDNLWQPLFLAKQSDRLIWVLGYAWVFIRLGTLATG